MYKRLTQLSKMLKLLVDDREQAVIPFFKESYEKVKIEVKRIQIGDYCITQNDKVLFCVERKTWRDLSASIKDGRDSNFDKMISLREQTNCKLLLLIEGKSRHSPKKKFARIPYKNLQAKLDHLMIRDNISVIYSNNEEDTTNRLIEFCTNYISLGISSSNILEGGSKEDNRETIPMDIDDSEAGPSGINEISILTTVVKKTDDQIIKNIWSCLPQVTTKTGELFIKNDIHISALLTGKISELDIVAMRYDNGTIIGKRATKILNTANPKDCEKKNRENYRYYCNILAEIPGITKNTAALILVKVTFIELLMGKIAIDDLAKIKKTEKSKIGIAAAEKIYKYLVKN